MKAFQVIAFLYLFCSVASGQDTGRENPDLTNAVSRISVVAGSKGDVDGNGFIEILDLIRARDIANGRLASPDSGQIFAADLNSDGSVTEADLVGFKEIFLLESEPPPTIFTLDRATAEVGDQISITGAGFDPSAANNKVTFGEITTEAISATETSLVVNVPIGAVSGNVVVHIANRKSNAVNIQITVQENAPLISEISPTAGLRGQTITISGVRFGATQGASELAIGDLLVQSDDILSWSDSEIMLRVPANAFPGAVIVKKDGIASNGLILTVTVVVVNAPDSSDILQTAEGLEYVRNEVILDFKNDVSLPEISNFLAGKNLTQVGIILRPRLIQARSNVDRDPFELANELAVDPLLEGAFASVFSQLKEVASESIPNTIGSSYDPNTARFNHHLTEEWYYHFAMRTFAGHRLVEVLLGKLNSDPPDVRVAIIDDGLGNGAITAPPEFAFRIKDPTVVGFTGFSVEVTSLAGVADASGHGTAVSGFAAGAGFVSLGTGKHVNIRPIKASQFAFATSGAIDIATDDPFVKVINLSMGSYERVFRPGFGIEIPVPEFVNTGRRAASSEVYDDNLLNAVSRGKVVVVAAGNENVDARLSAPANLGDDPAIMAVAGTTRDSDNGGNFERRWTPSNKGPVISVSAAAKFYDVVLRNNFQPTSGNGTSFAAPLVAGLAGEMFLVDEVLQRLGKRSDEISPQKVASIIEATADDMGSFGYDEEFGHGRINVWKALLATVNGGLTSEIPNPEWLGFEIRVPLIAQNSTMAAKVFEYYQNAQVYIDGRPLSDFGNSSVPDSKITLFKRVPTQRRAPREPYIPIPDFTRNTAQLMTTFSITTDEFKTSGSPSRMQFRRQGQTASDVPFLEFPLDLQNIRGGSLAAIKYDDFVYTAEIPRLLEIRSVQDGNARTITEMPVGKKAVTYPIAAVGESIEIDLAYPGYQPVVSSDIDVEFTVPGQFKITKPDKVENTPGQIVTNTVSVTVPDEAETGLIRIRTLDNNDDLGFVFAPFVDLVVAKGAGFEPEGTKPGDIVTISINVPHFEASTSNTRIKFSGPSSELVPDEVNVGSAPNVTHVIKVRIPDNLEEGPVTAIITVDDNRKVSFDVGNIVLFEKTLFAGSLNFNQMQITGGPVPIDLLPPSGKRSIPIRFTVNKNLEDRYFLSATVENGLFALGPDLTSALENNELTFSISSSQQGSNSSLEINLSLAGDLQSVTGTWRIEAVSPSAGVTVVFRANISADADSEPPSIFNGFFPGRPQRTGEVGDAELLAVLTQLLPAEPFLHFPLGFVQAEGLTAISYVFQQTTGAGTAASSAGLESLQKALSSAAANGSMAGDYRLLSYAVGSALGSQFTLIEDDAARFPYLDLDPDRNWINTYQLTRSGDNLTGTITMRMEVTDDDGTRSAELAFNYSGTLQKENEDNVRITAISPDPEAGFPAVTNNVVTLTSTTVSFNLATANEGSVVLRAFSNDNPTAILAEKEMPIAFTTNNAGILAFDNFAIPNVTSSVRRISIIAGIRPSGSSGFLVTSSALSYSR